MNVDFLGLPDGQRKVADLDQMTSFTSSPVNVRSGRKQPIAAVKADGVDAPDGIYVPEWRC